MAEPSFPISMPCILPRLSIDVEPETQALQHFVVNDIPDGITRFR
jgi:hypothetical protein